MPWITYLCIILCFANFLRELSLQSKEGWNEAAVECGAVYPPFVTQAHQYWRFITAGFVHFSWWHLLMNMYVLWQLGPGLEMGLGKGLYMVLLFGSMILGNVLTCYMGEDNHAISAGMSTALYGLMAFEIVYLAGMYGWTSVLQNRSVLYTLIVNLLMNFLPSISWKGHLGGACFGIIFAAILLRIW